jgi:hypothetical protein
MVFLNNDGELGGKGDGGRRLAMKKRHPLWWILALGALIVYYVTVFVLVCIEVEGSSGGCSAGINIGMFEGRVTVSLQEWSCPVGDGVITFTVDGDTRVWDNSIALEPGESYTTILAPYTGTAYTTVVGESHRWDIDAAQTVTATTSWYIANPHPVVRLKRGSAWRGAVCGAACLTTVVPPTPTITPAPYAWGKHCEKWAWAMNEDGVCG